MFLSHLELLVGLVPAGDVTDLAVLDALNAVEATVVPEINNFFLF